MTAKNTLTVIRELNITLYDNKITIIKCNRFFLIKKHKRQYGKIINASMGRFVTFNT